MIITMCHIIMIITMCHVIMIITMCRIKTDIELNLTACFVLGHSLGGALATLAAYDIKKQLQEAGRQSVEVVCYSFGAPRTGNHAFARDYNHVVPDTWSIINDQVHPAFMSRYAAAITWLMAQHICGALNLSGTDSIAKG